MPSSTISNEAAEAEIRVIVRLYSVLRHRDGEIVDRLEVTMPPGSRVRDVLERLQVGEEQLEPLLALNDELVEPEATLADGDRLAIIPSVAGGAREGRRDQGD